MVFTWINSRAGWHFVFTFSPFGTVRVRLCLRWTASKLSFWIILVFCDKLGRLYFWSFFKAIQYNSQVLHILTGTEDMTHGYWGYDSRVLHILMGTEDMTHRYWGYDSRVLHILTGTEDMTHGYWGYDSQVLHILTGTEDMTHGYWGYDSRVLRIWLTGTEDMTHGYCISSRVLRIWLTGTEDMTHGYWGYDSQVLHTLTGTEDMTHRYWWYDSRVMHILTGTAYPHGYCIPSRVLHTLTGTAYSLYRVTIEIFDKFSFSGILKVGSHDPILVQLSFQIFVYGEKCWRSDNPIFQSNYFVMYSRERRQFLFWEFRLISLQPGPAVVTILWKYFVESSVGKLKICGSLI